MILSGVGGSDWGLAIDTDGGVLSKTDCGDGGVNVSQSPLPSPSSLVGVDTGEGGVRGVDDKVVSGVPNDFIDDGDGAEDGVEKASSCFVLLLFCLRIGVAKKWSNVFISCCK